MFTPYPPHPEERYTPILMSCSFISISILLLSNKGLTFTDANDVCLLELESNGDILIKRCTPFSLFKYPYAFIPLTIIETLFMPASSPGCSSIISVL